MRSQHARDVEPDSGLLDYDDLDKGEAHKLDHLPSTERSHRRSTSSSSSLSKLTRRRRTCLGCSIPGWSSRRRAQPKSVFLLAVAGLVLFVLVCAQFSSATAPLQGVIDIVSPWGNAPKECTTWPVNEHGQMTVAPDPAQKRFEVTSLAPPGGWKKPKGFKIVGLVFYGRRRNVDILDCYLQQNLVANGGYLDEVVFMAHTKIEEEMAWLEDLVGKNQGHYKIVRKECGKKSFGCLWAYAVEDKTMYIKIDDDLLYVHPDAVPQLVHTRLNVPHPFAIGANLVNAPVTTVQHYHVGAIHPFMPEPNEKPSFLAAVTWRPSSKPQYPDSIDAHPIRNVVKMPVPYQGHTWLMTNGSDFDLIKTPVGIFDQSEDRTELAFSKAWESWGIAAQQQYSFLHNLEQNRVDRYFFGRKIEFPPNAKAANLAATAAPIEGGPGGEQVYDTRFHRYNLNFVAIWGSDIREQLPMRDDDERELTVDIPKRTQRPFLIDTRVIVSHLSFGTQVKGISQTDLVDRYRALANEAACSANNLKAPMDPLCPGFVLP